MSDYSPEKVAEPNKFRASGLLELIQAYDPTGNGIPIVHATVAVEGNRPYGDETSGYCGVLRLNYGFPNGDFDHPKIDDIRVDKLLRKIAGGFILNDRCCKDPVGVAMDYALLGERDIIERRKFNEEVWRIVAPNVEIPKIYATNTLFSKKF